MSETLAITQVGVIVRNIRESMERYHEAFGWAPWYIYEYKPPWFHGGELRGEPVEYSMLSAEVQAGPVWFELVQPISGPSIYEEWLDEHGEGLHHLIVGWDVEAQEPQRGEAPELSAPEIERIADRAALVRRKLDSFGAEVLMSGRIGRATEFYYLDTEPLLKLVIESGGGHPSDLEPIEIWPPA